ncbi:MAG: hypothetical protein WAO19_06075 [Candidatus Kryptoniota bacterium]
MKSYIERWSEVISLFLAIACFSADENAIAQGVVNPSWPDSTTFNLTSILGGDLFLTGEAYALHFGPVGFFSLTAGGGLGIEMRLRPVFVGFVVSASSHEIRPDPSGPFFNTSLYGGAIIQNYRLEIGEMHGDTFMGDPLAPNVSYTTYFLGLSKRFGSAFFAEPEIKVMFPIVAGYYQYGPPDYYDHVVTEHYGIRDLFFAFGLKLGIGFDSYR